MNAIYHLRDEIAVVGWACRLPGAKSVAELWALLLEGRCAISRVPEDRFSLEQFGHPRRQERGKSYTWAAGILDDVWGFDPGVFGISPREAVQIDPQQRILLQLTWEALEDAGIRPSSIANSGAGVFVGASQTEYSHGFFGDPALADAHFAPGTALAILANRISYVYGLHGPSITVDTACSSSLVALHQALEALRTGRIDTAIVGGSNLIASPASFIAFSQANMLSPEGLCKAFSADADGFVRAEGAMVLILRKASHAQANKNPIHGIILASDVNSDGRTNGISLPSVDAQESLLRRIYSRHNIDLDRLAFVEAHGTGTPVGDPVEATAIGRSIGHERSNPLPIGSIKTNIGHLEPASGLAGVLKALLALNHGILPPSLHFTAPNPHIEFDALNLTVCAQSLLLPNSAEQYAGVNSFGFGGTNAHAIVAAGRKASSVPAERAANGSGLFALSAGSNASLVELARQHAEHVEQLSDQDSATLASAIIHRREHQSNRIVISSTRSQDVGRALNAFIAGSENAYLTTGTAIGNELPIAFVYSGNGGQWAGMGVSAYQNNAHFRMRFEQVDSYFKQIGGWSLREALFSDTLQERLPLTNVAQPLIFAIQSACTAALTAGGLQPAAVLGHSVGEVAAAEAAGILDLRTAVKVIHFRSTHQEMIRGEGRMAAVFASPEAVQEMAGEVKGIEVAAINSPRAVTVAGPINALSAFKRLAANRGIVLLDLDLDYPFHTALMAPIEKRLTADLRDITPFDADVPFVSSVTGACLPGSRLGGNYWWRNVREPVQFTAAVRATAKLGARYFVEIGPRPTLLKHVTDSLQGELNGFATLAVLDRSDEDIDPFDKARAKAMVSGAQIDLDALFGPDPGPTITLPHYPWQQSQFRFKPTPEAIGVQIERHPFAGARHSIDALVWRSHIDTALYPELADHKVGEQTFFPGTAFLEITLAVARQWLRTETVLVTEFEILNPLDLTNGETREIMTRVSPGSNAIEIFSRPRLSQTAWLLHCRGKMQTGHEGVARGPGRLEGGRVLDSAAIYRLADDSGIHYGSAFRLVEKVIVHDGKIVDVELTPPKPNEPTRFLLDPMRLDCCGHGFFTVFPELRAEERGVTYIPVRLEEIALYRPHTVPHRALIEIVSKSERSIVNNSYIYGPKGEIIAVLRGVRSQAISTRRTGAIESIALVELPLLADGAILARTGVTASAGDIVAGAKSLGLLPAEGAPSTDGDLLVEGWATAAAYEIALGLADHDVIDIDVLVARGLLPAGLRAWMTNILVNLEAAGLAKQEAASWTLIRDSSLPSSTSVVKALASEQQSRAAELLLAAAMSGFAEQVLSGRAVVAPSDSIVSKTALNFYNTTSTPTREASDALYRVLMETKRLWPNNRALRILQIGFGPLAHSLISCQYSDGILLTIFEPDRRIYERAEVILSKKQEVRLVDADHAHELERYDLIVAAAGLHRWPSAHGFAGLKGLLTRDGLLIAVEHRPSLFKDLVFGLDPAWFLSGLSDRPSSPLRPAHRWASELEAAGFHNAQATPILRGSDLACLIVAEAEHDRRTTEQGEVVTPQLAPAKEKTALVVTSAESSPLAVKLAEHLSGTGLATSMIAGTSEYPSVAPNIVVLLPEITDDAGDPVAALTRRCLQIKACAEKIGAAPATLWLIFSGALAAGSSRVRPVETGAWAFSRTLANELQKLDVRRIDIASHRPLDAAAEQIQRIIVSGTSETELHVDDTTVRAVRVVSLKRTLDGKTASRHTAAKLERRSAAGQRLTWQPVERKRPGAGELEIEVEATGLNFRDLMWSLSLLPEDMLEDGFSGATLGLECAGRVARVGASVANFKVGDRVMAFAAASFATHVTVKAGQAVKLPAGLSCASAATIPVAFFTAYYSLVTLAKLARREWVLIHGGAGGVGMAAIQIAQNRGARVIATAGSPAKRSLLRALGVPHVLDSRSTSFVDEVRKITGSGVDVVLNSLSGEAMERSIACLRPFGRFVELGKRDYVTNTHIGLRPFRKNLSYFGVDVDQLIGARKTVGERTYSAIMRQFATCKLVPLPHSVFEAAEVSEAFHLMQQSSHIGKIVLRPPRMDSVRPANKRFEISAEGTHVVTGAFGGFGLETAKWLVEQGARYLVLIGRRGAATPEAQAVLHDFTVRGVKVVSDPCDVTDRKALEQLFEIIHATMPPIVGIIHAAMVLDDAVLANLDAERFRNVLLPKVSGAENLDHVTRGQPLDYFVLFSSVTTLIGNPGQSNYVAANAYMEGLARRRRQKGLPALAIGWGPITDVGVVARNQRLQSGLQKLTGVMGMRAREALEFMAQALEQPADVADTAVMTISPNDGSFGADRLAVLRSPTYAGLLSRAKGIGERDGESIDLHALAASEGIESARRKVADVITLQLARVLHLREEDISQVRPLGEIGLDSLMALELVMNLEQCFNIHVPLAGSSGGMTIADIADEVIAHVGLDQGREKAREETVVTTLAEQHHGKIEAGQITVLKEMMDDEAQKARRLLN